MRILILGVNGFIGHHLTERLLNNSDFEVIGMDLESDRLNGCLGHPRFKFTDGDITINNEWIEYNLKKADVVLPLVAIATPITYVKEPLRVFELDFEANLKIIRLAVKYNIRVIFPSTSEVYGISNDVPFHPLSSELTVGPIGDQRWIYSISKQLLDRVMHAYGLKDQLNYTLFRPFNWYGTGLDSLETEKEGGSRVVTQFLSNLKNGRPIQLVDGGLQKRCFTHIDDGIDALAKIIEDGGRKTAKQIYNIGNPDEEYSIEELAKMMIKICESNNFFQGNSVDDMLKTVSAKSYYGEGYADVKNRVPWIENTKNDLDWRPRKSLEIGLTELIRHYAH